MDQFLIHFPGKKSQLPSQKDIKLWLTFHDPTSTSKINSSKIVKYFQFLETYRYPIREYLKVLREYPLSLSELNSELQSHLLPGAIKYGYLDLIKRYTLVPTQKLFLRSLKYNQIEIIEYFLTYPEISIHDPQVLIYCLSHSSLKLTQCLIQHGMDLNLTLVAHAGAGHLEIVQWLIEQGADVHFNENEALRVSVEGNQIKVVKYLVDYGADTQISETVAKYVNKI